MRDAQRKRENQSSLSGSDANSWEPLNQETMRSRQGEPARADCALAQPWATQPDWTQSD